MTTRAGMRGAAVVDIEREDLGLEDPKAIAVVFATVYTSDVLLNTALGLYKPSTWSKQDWTIDLLDKFVQAAATGVLYDTVLGPDNAS